MSRRVANDEAELCAVIELVLGKAAKVTWAIDLDDTPAALVTTLLLERDQVVVHLDTVTFTKDVVIAALTALPAMQRAVVVLRYIEDLPVDAVAVVLQISPGPVKSHSHRALGNLRDNLAPHYVNLGNCSSPSNGRHDS